MGNDPIAEETRQIRDELAATSTMTFASLASTTCHGNKQKRERLRDGLTKEREKTMIRWLDFGMTELLSDEDEGIAEALLRDAEIEADPAQAISLGELDLISGAGAAKWARSSIGRLTLTS